MRAKPVPAVPLAGLTVVVTRPTASATGLVRRLRRLGAQVLRLPGSSVRGNAADAALCAAWREAMRGDACVFSSPNAVRYAAALGPWRGVATAIALGPGTAAALRRRGITAVVPARADSEGVLALPAWAQPCGLRVTLVGAAGGRELLRDTLHARGAQVRELHVYRRTPPRLTVRHQRAVLALPCQARVLLTSAEAIGHLQAALPPDAWRVLLRTVAVVGSERLARIARQAGFGQVLRAASAHTDDLLAALR